MRRREFIAGLGGAVAPVVWSVAARAQRTQRMRRIGVFMSNAVDDPEGQARAAGFLQGLAELGWIVGRNVRIDWRWITSDRHRYQTLAAELLALQPDVLLTAGATVRPTLLETRTIPIVFAGVNDPVGGGYVASLARPGGNLTGFASSQYGTSGKWLELLKEIAPHVTRAAVIRDPVAPGGTGQYGAIQAVASSFRIEVSPIDGRDGGELERAVAAFAQDQNGGLIVTGSSLVSFHRERIISIAERYRLPTVYSNSSYVAGGGLISYGPVTTDLYRLAAGYVDRILRGEKPADLPVQEPVKYETVLNLKTARALGLGVPATVLARADEVIE
jgi:putative tryptophan/tyrosine transport system substrate-binding protein